MSKIKISKKTKAFITLNVYNEKKKIILKNKVISYIPGTQTKAIPAIVEKALNGKEVGEHVSVNVSPQNGYGLRDETLFITVSSKQFDANDKIELGKTFQLTTCRGTECLIVTEMNDKFITLDANHPLAGMTLLFEIFINDIQIL